MKSNELRIGNFATLRGVIKTVNGALIKDQQQSEMIEGEVYLESILLTEEWLVRLGFKRFMYDW
jgi:hypothetical protein